MLERKNGLSAGGCKRFYVDSNSVSVISGRREDDNGRLYASEPRLLLTKFPPPAGIEPKTARSADQRYTHCYEAPELAKIIFGKPSELENERKLSQKMRLK